MKQIIYFSAGWCSACKAMEPAIDQLEKSKKAQVAKINTDYDASHTEAYNVKSVPTIIVLENGQEAKRHTGAMTYEQLISFIN